MTVQYVGVHVYYTCKCSPDQQQPSQVILYKSPILGSTGESISTISNGVITTIKPVKQELPLECVLRKSTSKMIEQRPHKSIEYR